MSSLRVRSADYFHLIRSSSSRYLALGLAQGAIPLPANFADISNRRLSELIASDDDGKDDPEPELIGETVTDLESDKDASSESSLDN
ncbi:hypothetical protein NUW54_g10323 [Trametes sanguinea]|uniref:Uncharacterized protein n=1 Tax=Trametes sanguinea TaxID=158606 RepID=A0ACC1P1G7_9APHY|nr:hypothetical protein NUW54_g10323 [Trametes sanguinea]